MHEGKVSPEGERAGLILDHETSLAFGSLIQRLLVGGEVNLGVGIKQQIALDQIVLEIFEHNLLGLFIADFFLTLFDFKIDWLRKEWMLD